MGMAPLAHTLWSKFLNFSSADPHWRNRDRFILSNGHACALQYIMLHLTGYKDFPMEELQKFRQLHSNTPGHPENVLVGGGIEVTTGPLGQGIANAVGLAMAEAHFAAVYNKPEYEIFNHHTYAFCGDGCLQEGVSAEAASLGGHLGLNKLIVFYDDNQITIDGETELSFTEDVNARMTAYGWHVIHVQHADTDPKALIQAVEAAHQVKDKPVFIKVTTTIGFGSSKQGTEKVHGSPLGADDIIAVKKKFGFDPTKSFVVPEEVRQVYGEVKKRGDAKAQEWQQLFEKYTKAYPKEAEEIQRRFDHKLPEGWKAKLPTYKPTDDAKATRQFSQSVIKAISPVLPELFGGSADLNPSTLTYMDCSIDFQKKTPQGRNVRFGVREHGMAAVLNGLSAYGGFIPFGSTFLNFIGYAMGAVRLSAISSCGILYIMTHDSIGVGEDGPTHQPIETLPMLRALPHLVTLRPADGNETSGAYAVALEHRKNPTVLALSRQPVPNLEGTSIDGVYKGAYTIRDVEGTPQIILVGTGTEVHWCVNAAKEMTDVKVRVVSMPSWELFREQSLDYQKSVFPDGVPVMSVEAASVSGWKEFAHVTHGMTTFGASGPLKDVMNHFGFNTETVVKKARQVVAHYGGNPAPILRSPF